MDFIDVAIVGGGPAGLTAANTLARQNHTAVVFDPMPYIYTGVAHMHTILTWDLRSLEEYRSETMINILASYDTIQFVGVAVTKIEKKSDSHFEVTDASGKVWSARKVMLAVGSMDTHPDVEGYSRLWKKQIFHCLLCRGYEYSDSPSSGVLAIPPIRGAVAARKAQNAAQFTHEVTLYTNGNNEVTAELEAIVGTLIKPKLHIEARQIKRLVGNDEANSVTVELIDGSSKEEKFLVHKPQTIPQGPFVGQLGLATTPLGDIQTKGSRIQTTVPGVFAVGDCSSPYKNIPSAIASGRDAGVMVSAEIQDVKYAQPTTS
ncbi:FAD/NAD(P)-binding domain-containing protein [Hypoxylon sp. NC0597]|nr:FAD/NAD(P)-binding domain-containing protein [Hypoxylon sp. NC0597]